MDAPPSYDQVTGSSTGASNRPVGNTLQLPGNGIPPASRRSMEDEGRALPPGWIRQYDHQEHHQFFVDTKTSPPRSIWHHPYDDEQYLSTLSSEERERLQETHRTPTTADLEAELTDEDDHHDSGKGHDGSDHFATNAGTLPPRPDAKRNASQSSTKKQGLGRKMKDKLTNSTHQEREEKRRLRAEQEQKEYEAHQAFRRAMSKAMETGQPQLIGKDKDGKDVYVEPPAGPGDGYGGGGMYGGGGGMAGGMYGGGGYGYNPYRQGPYAPPYSTGSYGPNSRYIRPSYPYSRPMYGGYGGGMGMPLMGGLMGGMMLGGLMF